MSELDHLLDKPEKPRRQRRWWKIVLIGLLLAIVLGGGGAADKPLAKMSYAEFEAKRNAEERRTDAFGW